MRRSVHRTIDIIVGVPFLLVGACGILIDVASLIYYAKPRPNEHATITFPMGMIIGAPFLWFGFRLVFRRGAKSVAANPNRSADSN
jgi:hypothetical protein